MILDVPDASRANAGRSLAGAASWVWLGTMALGLTWAVARLLDAAPSRAGSGIGWVRVGLLALADLGLAGLAGGVVSLLMRAWAGAIEAASDRADAIRRGLDILEHRVAPALERLATAPVVTARDDRAAVRAAVTAGRWDEAEALLRADPEAATDPRLVEEVAEGRRVAAGRVREALEAARGANDPDRVIELRGELARLLPADASKELDRQIITWLMGLIQRRLRAGSMRADVALLAAKIGDAFPGTPEGASLRASLSTLRRSAGLCPRCARPFTGLADACPECRAAAAAPTPMPPPPGPQTEAAPGFPPGET